MRWITEIEGASVFSEIKLHEDYIHIPKCNPEYKVALLTDEVLQEESAEPNRLWLLASKDGKEFSIAVAVKIDGQEYTAIHIKKMLPDEDEYQEDL